MITIDKLRELHDYLYSMWKESRNDVQAALDRFRELGDKYGYGLNGEAWNAWGEYLLADKISDKFLK